MRIQDFPTAIRRHPSRCIAMVRAVLIVMLASVAANAQTFNSGSNGSDGALNLTTPGTIIFDPPALGLDTDGDNVFHFTTITIGAEVTVQLKNVRLRGRSVVWLASGAVQIAGTVDLSGEAGHLVNDPVQANRRPSEPGPGGYSGGVGATPTSAAQPGNGPGGAGRGAYQNLQQGYGGGHATAGCAYGGIGTPSAAYGNVLLLPLRGGSGGGGGGSGVFGGGGGAGGGALRIASSVAITVNGTIKADGGDGGTGSVGPSQTAQGGGGSGGGVHLIAPTIGGTGVIQALGGGGAGVLCGSVGRIRVDAFQQQFTGSSNPAASLGTPYNVPLPANVPTVRAVSVAGIPVPSPPNGSFTMPDITINQTVAVPIVIEAKNIPVGTVVRVYLFSEAAPDKIENSTPLTGTLQLSTATANVVIPPGFSRGYVRATWTP